MFNWGCGWSNGVGTPLGKKRANHQWTHLRLIDRRGISFLVGSVLFNLLFGGLCLTNVWSIIESVPDQYPLASITSALRPAGCGCVLLVADAFGVAILGKVEGFVGR